MMEKYKQLFKSTRVQLCLSIILLFIFMALLADIIAPYDPIEIDLSKSCNPPSKDHLLGTDELGRDILSRIIYGSRLTITISFVATALGATAGIFFGVISGYFGGIVDTIIQRITEILLALPGFLLAIMFVAIMGSNLWTVIVSVSISMTPSFIRMVRGLALQVRELEYVLAAKQLGANSIKIMFRHVIPNISPTIIAQVTLNLGTSILFASGLGFLGIGVPPPAPEWGTMLGTGRAYIFYAPHLIIFPGLSVFLLVLSFNIIGDKLGEIIASK
ncbi:MAG: ABC transporter permease [Nitrososphaeria archaeon]|nr:ABC transporter permease [Nitrososphaeria archaeon]